MRTVGYDNDDEVLRREFGSYTELDEIETAGGRADSRRQSQRKPEREHVTNPGALVGWCSSENLGRLNRRLNKPRERIGKMVLSPLADRVYIFNKLKLDYLC